MESNGVELYIAVLNGTCLWRCHEEEVELAKMIAEDVELLRSVYKLSRHFINASMIMELDDRIHQNKAKLSESVRFNPRPNKESTNVR